MWDGGDGVEQSVDRRLFHWCKFSENQEAMQPREETDSAAAGSCDMGRVGGEGVVQPGEEDTSRGKGQNCFHEKEVGYIEEGIAHGCRGKNY